VIPHTRVVLPRRMRAEEGAVEMEPASQERVSERSEIAEEMLAEQGSVARGNLVANEASSRAAGQSTALQRAATSDRKRAPALLAAAALQSVDETHQC
jgi:hypothetical protein